MKQRLEKNVVELINRLKIEELSLSSKRFSQFEKQLYKKQKMTSEQHKIIEIASSYIGKREIKGNLGFEDKAFESEMIAVGWGPPMAWCSFFSELVWRKAYGLLNSVIEADLNKLFSGGAIKTYTNFKESKNYHQYISQEPVIGSLVVFRQGSGWQGHIGILKELTGKEMKVIEGNTDGAGGREGIEVAIKRRLINFESKEKGLNLIGFIHPPNILNHA